MYKNDFPKKEIIERIYDLLEEQNKKASDLCVKLDVRTSTMSTWKARKSDPPAKYLKSIADFFDVSLDYLATGKDASVQKTTTLEEDQLLILFKALPENKRFEFIGELKGFLKAMDDTQKYLDDEKRLLG